MSHSATRPQAAPGAAAQPLADIYARPGFQIRRAHQVLMAVAEQACARLGLTPHQHTCISILGRCGPLDQNTLARAIGMDRATLGQLLHRLEAGGLIERRAAVADQRRKLVSLTAAGSGLVAAADNLGEQVTAQLMAVFTASEQKQFLALLTQFNAAHNASCPVAWEPPTGETAR